MILSSWMMKKVPRKILKVIFHSFYLHLIIFIQIFFKDAGDDLNSTASSELSLSVSRHVEPREDPEVIKQWKENQVKMLQEKDQEEEKAREELKDQAKKELEDWYKQHSEQLSKLQAANRAASISYEQELETTTTKVNCLLWTWSQKINLQIFAFFLVGARNRMGKSGQIVWF